MKFVHRFPFAGFYGLAIAFPVLLFAYLFTLESLAPDLYGPGIGTLQHFKDLMAHLLAGSPLLAQHRDSVLVYLTLYAGMPLAAPFLLFPLAPTLSALLVTAVGYGGGAVRALLGAFAPVRGKLGWRDGLRLYGLLLLVLSAIVAAALLYESLLHGGARLAQMRKVWGLGDLVLFASGWGAALWLNQGGLLEELGWRGYAWPVLVRKFGDPLTAAVLLGLAWALWHFPREVPALLTGQVGLLQLLRDQALFITSCIGMTLVSVSFVNLSGGSVLPAIMVHGVFNFVFLGFESGNTGVRSAFDIEPPVLWALAGLLTWWVMGRDLGWSRRLAAHGGDGRTDPSLLWTPRP